MLPRFRAIGVDPNMVLQVSTGQATVWPAGNLAVNNSARRASRSLLSQLGNATLTHHYQYLSMSGNQNWLPPVP